MIWALFIILIYVVYYLKKSRDDIKILYEQIEKKDALLRDLIQKNINDINKSQEGLRGRCSHLHDRVVDIEKRLS